LFGLIAVIAPFGLVVKAAESRPTLAKIFAVPFTIVAGGFQFYFWGGWSAFCVALADKYVARPETSAHWLYWTVAFLSCTSPLAYLTSQEMQTSQSANEARGTQRGGCMYSIAAMLAFFLFFVWRDGRELLYGWALHFIV